MVKNIWGIGFFLFIFFRLGDLFASFPECSWHGSIPQDENSPVYKGIYEVNGNTFKGELQFIPLRNEKSPLLISDYHLFIKLYLGDAPWGEYFVYFYPNIMTSYSHCSLISKNKGPILHEVDFVLNQEGKFSKLHAKMVWPFDGNQYDFHFYPSFEEFKEEAHGSLRGLYQGQGDGENRKFVLELHSLKAPYDYVNLTSNPFLPYDIKGFIGEKTKSGQLVRFSIKKGKYDFLTNKLEILLTNAEKSWPILCDYKKNRIRCANGMEFKKVPLGRIKESPPPYHELLPHKISWPLANHYFGVIEMLGSKIKIPLTWDFYSHAIDRGNVVVNFLWEKSSLSLTPHIPILFEDVRPDQSLFRGHQFLCKLDYSSGEYLQGEFFHMQWGKIGNFFAGNREILSQNNYYFNSQDPSLEKMLPHGKFHKGTGVLDLYLWLDDDIQVQEGSYYFPLKISGRFFDTKTKMSLNLINGQFDLLNLEINGELENGQLIWGHTGEDSIELILTNVPQKRAKMHPWALEEWRR